MKILVITATLGTSIHLNKTIASVDTHKKIWNDSIHHVLVAPASRVQELSNAYPQCEIIEEGAKGLYSAINTALKSAEIDFWTYLNDDDVFLSGFSEVIKLAIKKSENIIYGKVLLINENNKVINEVTRLPFPFLMHAALAGKRSPLNQQGVIFPGSTLRNVGLFDVKLKYAADLDYFCRCSRLGYSFNFISKPVAGFRVTPGQLSTNENSFKNEIAAVRAQHPVPKVKVIIANYVFFISNLHIYFLRLVLRRGFGFSVFKARS
jgi:hypothetical protein